MAEGTTIFDAVIRAVDKFSEPLRGMMAHVHGMTAVMRAAFGETEKEGNGVHHVGAELHKTGEEAKKAGHEIQKAAHPHGYEVLAGHISLLRTHFGALSVSTGEVGRNLSEFLPMLAGLGAAGGLVGLFEMTEKAAENFSVLSSSARQVGMSAQQYATFAQVAKTVDVPATNMAESMFRLNRVIGDSLAGKNKDAAALFAHLGIALRGADGHIRSAAELMPQLAEAFQHTHDPAMQARMAMALFSREGMQLLPLLTQGREKLEELSKAAQSVIFVPQGDAAEKLEEYHASLLMLTAAVQGFMLEIGTKLAPVLKPVIDLATRWVVANRDWIATKLADYVRQLAYWIEQLRFPVILEHMSAWIRTAGHLVDRFGGLNTVIGAFAFALASPMISAVLGIISVFARLAMILRGLAILTWANPILVAVGLLAAAGIDIYRQWDPVKSFWQNMWNGMRKVVEDAWAIIRPIVFAMERAGNFLGHEWVAIGRELGVVSTHAQDELFTLPEGAAVGAARPLPRLYGPGGVVTPGAAANAAANANHATVTIRLPDAPPGTRVRVDDPARTVTGVDVGHSMPGAGYGYGFGG